MTFTQRSEIQSGWAGWTEEVSSPVWLDSHLALARTEYEAACRCVSIPSGADVLDVGSGSGAFVEQLAAAAGPGGRVTAVDIDAHNLEVVADRYAGPADLITIQASALELPLASNSRDVAWCANVSTYLDDCELACMLAELVRVVRPGGCIAIKETDADLIRTRLVPRSALRRLLAAAAAHSTSTAALLRAADLPCWLEAAGLTHVRQDTLVVERRAPIDAAGRVYVEGVLDLFGDLAASVDPEDPEWCALVDPVMRKDAIDDPDFHWTEGIVVVQGTVSS